MINVYHFKNNYGDDLAWFILSGLADDEIRYCIPFDWKRFIINLLIYAKNAVFHHCFNAFPYPYSAKQNILLITGSILGLAKKNCTVWGCGITFENDRTDPRAKIMAVRGPFTIKCVQAVGIDTKNIPMGDPGLLMPLILPRKEKIKFTFGIISHINDVKRLSALLKNDKDVLFISLNTSKHSVEDITKQIHSCKFILSSSLHGLIVSHAYGIPALRIDSSSIPGDGIKFKDYFASVGIKFYKPFSADEVIGLSSEQRSMLFHDHLAEALPGADVKKIQTDLLKAAPFPLKPQFKNMIES